MNFFHKDKNCILQKTSIIIHIYKDRGAVHMNLLKQREKVLTSELPTNNMYGDNIYGNDIFDHYRAYKNKTEETYYFDLLIPRIYINMSNEHFFKLFMFINKYLNFFNINNKMEEHKKKEEKKKIRNNYVTYKKII